MSRDGACGAFAHRSTAQTFEGRRYSELPVKQCFDGRTRLAPLRAIRRTCPRSSSHERRGAIERAADQAYRRDLSDDMVGNEKQRRIARVQTPSPFLLELPQSRFLQGRLSTAQTGRYLALPRHASLLADCCIAELGEMSDRRFIETIFKRDMKSHPVRRPLPNLQRDGAKCFLQMQPPSAITRRLVNDEHCRSSLI